MATLTSTEISAGVQPKGLRVGLVAVTAVYSLAATLSGGDVIQMIKVPQNATVVDLKVVGTVTCGSVTVGDGVDTDRYIEGYALSVSAGMVSMSRAQFQPYTYSTDDTIDCTVSASTSMSNAGYIAITAIYAMDT